MKPVVGHKFRYSPSISGPLSPPPDSHPWMAMHACAAESQHQEAETAYGKHSSPEAVKTFIIITNLQAPTEPGGAEAAKQPLHLPGFHILPWCIRRLEESFFAGHTKSYLLACISLLCLSSRLRDGMTRGCVCQKKQTICVWVPSLHSQQTEWDKLLCSYSYNRCTHSWMYVCVCVWLDGITLRESGRMCLFEQCVCTCVCVLLLWRESHSSAHMGQT